MAIAGFLPPAPLAVNVKHTRAYVKSEADAGRFD